MNEKIGATIVGVMAAVLALSKLGLDSDVQENFISQPLGINPMTTMNDCRSKGDMFQVPPSYKSRLPPRFNPNGCYSSFIRYGKATPDQLAVPSDPLAFKDLAEEAGLYNGTQQVETKEGFCGPCGDVPTDANQAYGPDDPNLAPEVIDSLPVSGMDMPAMDDGDCSGGARPYVVDRMVYSLQRSRLHGQGDYIRGDLPIPKCNAGGGQWFTPSANPQFALNTGALGAMGGLDMDTARATYALVNQATAGQKTTMGGANLTAEFESLSDREGCAPYAGTDLSFTAFP